MRPYLLAALGIVCAFSILSQVISCERSNAQNCIAVEREAVEAHVTPPICNY